MDVLHTHRPGTPLVSAFARPQLQGEDEVLHTARVRHDWSGGGKLDLSVRQDERVEILRVKNNPGGKWLARSATGNCEFGRRDPEAVYERTTTKIR